MKIECERYRPNGSIIDVHHREYDIEASDSYSAAVIVRKKYFDEIGKYPDDIFVFARYGYLGFITFYAEDFENENH